MKLNSVQIFTSAAAVTSVFTNVVY